ncbi:MAG: hypothetical protein Q7J01_02010, partial [Syntrophales bacterium]|nr:hypothetical protein [Syntrophales bacterium]
ASFYAEDFSSKMMDRGGCLAFKVNLFRLNKDIHVGVKNFKITRQSRHKVVVTFEQRYRSSRVNDVGTKTLYLKNVDNSWKICKELWKQMK